MDTGEEVMLDKIEILVVIFGVVIIGLLLEDMIGAFVIGLFCVVSAHVTLRLSTWLGLDSKDKDESSKG